MTRRKRMLTWLIPMGIVIILFLALWMNLIINERTLPSSLWSRTVHPNIVTKSGAVYTFKDSSGINLYTLKNRGLTHTVLNDSLKVTSKNTMKTDGKIQRVIWADKDSIIYKMNGNLHLLTDGKKSVIAKSVGDVKVADNVLYFTQEKSLFTYNLKLTKRAMIQTFNAPIQMMSLENRNAIIVTQDEASNLHFYVLKTDDRGHAPHEFARYDGLSHGNISTLNTVQYDGKLGLFFTTHVLRQGEYFFNYYLEFPLDKLAVSAAPVTINATNITFTVKGTGEYLQTPADTHLYLVNNQPTLLFDSEGRRTLRDTAINIYEGTQNSKGKWVAERRSTSPEMSRLPFLVDSGTIGYLDFISGDDYQIGFTSQNQAVIDQSKHYQTKDFSQSLSNAVLSLSRVFMFFLLSIAFAIPSILVYAIISFTKVELIERDSNVVKWLLLAVFFVSQLFLIGHTQTASFQAFAPGYLTFTASRWTIPIIMALITWLLVRWVKTKDWSVVIETFYAMILFSVMEYFTFGPYFF